MRFLVDLSSSQPQGEVMINGGGEYAFRLFETIIEKLHDGDSIIAVFNSQLKNNETAIQYCKTKGIQTTYYDSVDNFSTIISESNCDCVILPVCYYKYTGLHINDSVRLITVIHDLCDVYFNDRPVKYGRYIKSDGLNWLRKIKNKIVGKRKTRLYINAHNKVIHLNHNQTVITVSYYTKSAFRQYLSLEDYDNVLTLYPPEIRSYYLPENERKEQRVLQKYGLTSKKYFMLCAGSRWTKNNAIVLFTLDKMFSNEKYRHLLEGYRVIIIGTDKVNRDYYYHNISNSDKFTIDGYVDNMTIDTLYKHAHLFVFPSVLEGFGQPPVEAMKYGTVSACSNEMCIPEICGDAVLYFNPYDAKAVEHALLQSFDLEYMTILHNNIDNRFRWLKNKRETDYEILLNTILEENME